MFYVILFAYFYVLAGSNKIYYDSFHGNILSEEELHQHIVYNTTFYCVTEIEPCDPEEGRRVDGSCNNLNHPIRGAIKTPYIRLLPAIFDEGYEPRKSKSGNELPLPRRLRTSLLAEGRVPSQCFTHLLTDFFVFIAADSLSGQDTVNYIIWTPYCCLEQGKTDAMCTPLKIPDNDPVHRFSGERCLNLTRPITFQNVGCFRNDTLPERFNAATPLLDLSVIYATNKDTLLKKARKGEVGLLKTEIENGKIWPPSFKKPTDECLLNQLPHETRCHDIGANAINSLLGINKMGIWFWRYHNVIANHLAKLNPTWSDNKLFLTARDINIAVVTQIFYYELLPELLGYDNLIKDNVILPASKLFRDVYNENILPQLSLEYLYVLRWVHLMQEGTLRLFDSNGHYLKQIPVVNLTGRTGYLLLDNNIDHITQGAFRQGSANIDYIIDPFISEIGMGPLQRVLDITSNDLAKTRLFGFQSYTKYLEYCNGRPFRKYEDLTDFIDPERIELLKEEYEHTDDIDLLAGIWLEKQMKNAVVPPTFYCIVVEQLIRNIVSDRHWFERPNRPNAFNSRQLREIKKASIARLLCDVGDSVTHIQPKPFLRIGPNNKLRRCKEIKKINFNVWKEDS